MSVVGGATYGSADVMRPIHLAIGLLVVGAAPSAAQKADSAAGQPGSIQSGPAAPSASGQWADGEGARCWLGCTGSLQRSAPAEWSKTESAGLDSLSAHLGHTNRPPVKTAAKAGSAVSGAATSGVQATARCDSTTTPPATEAQAQRYLIEEWRRSELNIADSIHHGVLIRITHLYDSAQRTPLSPDQRISVIREVDGINGMNQMMWFERRAEVNRAADSTARAAGLVP
jgi:hypothetical protein